MSRPWAHSRLIQLFSLRETIEATPADTIPPFSKTLIETQPMFLIPTIQPTALRLMTLRHIRIRRTLTWVHPGLRIRPIRKVQELRLLQYLIRIPLLLLVTKILPVFAGLEFASQKIVFAVRDDEAALAVEVVDNFHVEFGAAAVVEGFLDALEFEFGGFDEHELGGEDVVEPVGAWHGDWC